jgi:hypothetical protein
VVNRQIEIECLPTDIPDNISADISAMGLGDALHVYDLKVPAGLKIISGAELTIAVVNAQEEETVKPAGEAAAATAAAPAAGALPLLLLVRMQRPPPLKLLLARMQNLQLKHRLQKSNLMLFL